MRDLPGVLFVLFIVLSVVTLVGHGIWVLLGWMFGAKKPARPQRKCPFCEHLSAAGDRCDWCGRQLTSPLADELADLEAVQRQLRRFSHNKALKPEVARSLLDRVDRYRRQLVAPPPVAAEVVAAEVVPGPTPAVAATVKPEPQPDRRYVPPAGRDLGAARQAGPTVGPVVARVAEPPSPAQTPAAPAVTPPHAQPIIAPAPVGTEGDSPIFMERKLGQSPADRKPLQPTPKPPVPAAPRRSWTEMLAGFMEQRNIRWGELVGGLLLVCSSVALVVSFWKTLEQIPYFQFFIFVTISSAVFGVGLYAHHRWKLESTSRGLLIIATLLVPLNFVAMAAHGKSESLALTLATEAVSLSIFAWLVGLAARVLTPRSRWLIVLAVVGNSAAALLIARLIGPESPMPLFVGLGMLPVGLFAMAVGGHLYQLWHTGGAGVPPALAAGTAAPKAMRPRRKHPRLDEALAGSLFILLGVTAFSMLVALGLLVAQTLTVARLATILQPLSMLAVLAALPALAGGLTVQRGTARDASLAPYRLAGTTVALVAMAAMLVAIGLAWPCPRWIIAVGALNAAALVFAAFRWRLPILHAGAIACAALAYLTGFHLVADSLASVQPAATSAEMFRQMTSARSGMALAGLFVVLAAVSEILARWGHRRHGAVYMAGSAVVALAGLMLVTVHGARHGAGDALRAAILYGIYGAGCAALVARWRRVQLSYVGLGLLAAAPLWVLWSHEPTHHVSTVWAAVLGLEAAVMAAMAATLHAYFGGSWSEMWNRGNGDSPIFVKRKSGQSPGWRLSDFYRIPLVDWAQVVAVAGIVTTIYSAWRDRYTLHHWPSPVIAAACLAATYFILAWQYRSPQRTWAGSLIVLAGLVHTLGLNYADWIGPGWPVALLAHATLAVLAGLCMDLIPLSHRPKGAEGEGTWTRRVISQPLADSALFSSVLVLPALVFTRSGGTLWLAGCFAWLAVIWLVLAWRNRDVGLFAAHQAMLAAGAVAGATVWLRYVGWLVPRQDLPAEPNLLERIANVRHAVLDPRNLQVYGLVLGLLSIVWIALRIADRMTGGKAAHLLRSAWSVDRLTGHAVVLGQFLLVAVYLLPGEVIRELAAGIAPPVPAISTAFGPAAWLLLVVLGVMLAAALWERWREAELFSTLLLAASLPCVLAGQAVSDLAVASALRWGLSIVFIACAAAVWERKRLLQWCRVAGSSVEIGRGGPRIARAVLLATTALPVLAVTLIAALLQIGGTVPGGPAAKTFFDLLGPKVSYLVPLALVMAGLVGFAVRESSSGYAFSAGLVLEMIVTLGYALATTLAGKPMDGPFVVTLLQLATIAAAAWAIVWLMARQGVDVWREEPRPTADGAVAPRVSQGAKVLMNVQIGMATAGNTVLIGLALVMLAVAPLDRLNWTVAAGLPLGWIALVLPLAASQLRGRLRPNTVGLFGLAAMGLLACTVRGLGPYWNLPVEAIWGYRTLMLGWAIYALLVVLATWWVASVQTLADAEGPPQRLIRMAAVWLRIAAILAVLLGLKAAFWHDREQLWAAAAIAVASGAGATMAVWRRREGWAFSAALGVNLAASLVVWHFEVVQNHLFEEWWLRLVQANVIASAAVALVWLAARKRLYRLREMTLGESPFLAFQIALAVVGNFIVLLTPVLQLVYSPDYFPSWMAEMADAPGWLGLLLVTAAAGWYLRQTLPGNLLHVIGGLLLGAGVLAACLAVRLDPSVPGIPWLAYHVLLTAWAVAGVLVLGAAMLGRNWNSRPRLPSGASGSDLATEIIGPARQAGPTGQAGSTAVAEGWLTLIGLLVVGLAVLHGLHDPQRPWWSAGAVIAISAVFGVAALWLRRPAYVYFSGLLVNVAGSLVWWAWGPGKTDWAGWNPELIASLTQSNALCLAIVSAVWALLGKIHPAGVPHPQWDARPLPLAHMAAQFGAALVGLVVVAGVGADLLDAAHLPVQRLDWIALGAVAVAVVILLWDRSAGFALPALYALGLSAEGMALVARELTRQMVCWSAVNELAGFALVVAVVAWVLAHTRPVWRFVGIVAGETDSCRVRETHHNGLPIGAFHAPYGGLWFSHAQAVLVSVTALLGTWIAIDFAFDGLGEDIALLGLSGRWAALPALLMLLGATIVMAWLSEAAWRARWQYSAFAVGLLLNSSIGWARVDAQGSDPWLHRSVTLMVAAGMMTLLAGFGLKKVLPFAGDWLERGRRSVPALGGLAILALAAVMAQEAAIFFSPRDVLMSHIEIALVVAVLLGLAAACIAMAVVPGLDPLQWNDSLRQTYVYAAEVILGLVGLHVRFTMPWLFHGYIEKFWMLLVMAVAFVGAALSEWFNRRRLPILSQPLERTALLLPLAPAVGFWLMPEGDSPWSLVNQAPAPWLLMGLFYGILAVTRRSPACSVLAVLTGNLGLWVGLHQSGLHFLEHPQCWLIPLALAGLVAEHLNRDRLSEAQRTAFRYVALSVIYVSSTADMYIASVGKHWNWWLPLVLMLLSVAGVLIGMLLRIRSFLYLGVAFLVLDVFSIIWYAAVDRQQTWIWYVCGIALGAAIIALFAVFEKRRNDVLAAVEKLKEWKR